MTYRDYSHLSGFYQNEIAYCKSMKVGDKIKFKEDKRRFTVKAKSERFLICTKPFNLSHRSLYHR